VNNYKYRDSIIIILAFLLAVYGRKLLNQFADISFPSTVGSTIYYYAWWIVPIALTIGFLYGFKNILKELCLDKEISQPLSLAMLAVAPMLISSAIMGEVRTNIHVFDLLRGTLFAGFMEELLFRGFLFGILFRKLGWGFIPAAVLGAVIFGLSHIYQGSNVTETLGVFAVTFIGAAWFAWLFIEWDENLWVPILLHILMNLSWTLFEVSDNALGGFAPNIFRAVTIAITVIATIKHCKKRGSFHINRSTLVIKSPVATS
jgi:membrane protease YdiL (CAAX protease family)